MKGFAEGFWLVAVIILCLVVFAILIGFWTGWLPNLGEGLKGIFGI